MRGKIYGRFLRGVAGGVRLPGALRVCALLHGVDIRRCYPLVATSNVI